MMDVTILTKRASLSVQIFKHCNTICCQIRNVHENIQKLGSTHRISDIQESSCLTSFAIHCQRVTNCCLYNKPIQGCSKNTIIVISVQEHGVCHSFFSSYSIYNTLPQASHKIGITPLVLISQMHSPKITKQNKTIHLWHPLL